MTEEKRKAGDYTIKQSIIVGSKEIVMGEDFTNKDGMYFMVADYTEIFGVRGLYENILISNDYVEIAEIFIDRISKELNAVKEERKGILPDIITPDKCRPIDYTEDIKGKIVVINHNKLQTEYANELFQIVYVNGGFGSCGNSRGDAIFCTNLFTGEKQDSQRHSIIGELKQEHYPEWLKAKLEYREALKNPAVFEYGNNHFLPVGVIDKKKSLYKETKNLQTDVDLGYWHKRYESVYGKAKNDYTHKGFYDACKNIPCDIFKCIENGKFYIPAENELFEYTGKFEPYTEQETAAPTKAKKKSHKEVER